MTSVLLLVSLWLLIGCCIAWLVGGSSDLGTWSAERRQDERRNPDRPVLKSVTRPVAAGLAATPRLDAAEPVNQTRNVLKYSGRRRNKA